jgi:hypothetical protein
VQPQVVSYDIEQSGGSKGLIVSTGPRQAPGEPPTVTKKEPCCPYCVVDKKFYPMTVLANGRMICKNCGHIVFPDDRAFRCPCSKCLEVDLSPRLRRLRRR